MKRLTLATLLAPHQLPETIANLVVGDLRLDSRLIGQGDVFISLGGDKFIASAVDAGAVTVLCEPEAHTRSQSDICIDYFGMPDHQVPIVFVPNLKEKLMALAQLRYGRPSSLPRVVGITGTNGKSTLVALIAQLLNAVQPKVQVATIGTLGVGVYGEKTLFTGMTTPDILTNYQAMAGFSRAGVDVVAMEVSSHGLDQGRIAGLPLKTAVFTNLSQDHLDYHKTLESYANAKKQLFSMPSITTCIINADDPFSEVMVSAAKNCQKLFYGLTASYHKPTQNHVLARNIKANSNGTTFDVVTPWGSAAVKSPFFGEFNVYNCLAAICAAVVEGADFKQVVGLIPQLIPVKGRMQRLPANDNVQVVIDFAHTPDALEQTLIALKAHAVGRLWVVFGCGGDRDKQKRALMGEVAERLADEVVLTSDNPRTEDPNVILADIASGCKNDIHILTDRKEAIFYALAHAKAEDCVLIAGKGHEDFQLVGNKKLPFNDALVATELLSSLHTMPHEQALKSEGGL